MQLSAMQQRIQRSLSSSVRTARTMEESALDPGIKLGDSPNPLRLRTLKVLARSQTPTVEATRSGSMQAGGSRGMLSRVIKGERGKIWRDDGGLLMIMMETAGLIMIPKQDFRQYFQLVGDVELALSDVEDGEPMF